jgi:S-methylmethionine-dependent homocysteine/selenocysteine methylase
MVEFEAAVRDGASILTDGGIEARIVFETEVAMDPHVGVAALVGEPKGGPVLRGVYESYVEAAKLHGLPVIIGTPTFRASPNFVRQAGLGETKRCASSTRTPRRRTEASRSVPPTSPCLSPG